MSGIYILAWGYCPLSHGLCFSFAWQLLLTAFNKKVFANTFINGKGNI
jgi:hypothetical protein